MKFLENWKHRISDSMGMSRFRTIFTDISLFIDISLRQNKGSLIVGLYRWLLQGHRKTSYCEEWNLSLDKTSRTWIIFQMSLALHFGISGLVY